MLTTTDPVSLRTASLRTTTISACTAMAVLLVPVNLVFVALNFLGSQWAIELSHEKISGFDSLLWGVAKALLLPPLTGVPIAAAVWIGARIQAVINRLRHRQPDTEAAPIMRESPSIRDVVMRIAVRECFIDLATGFFWTFLVVGVPLYIILKLVGADVGGPPNVIMSIIGIPILAGMCTMLVGPVLMLGFWLIRGVSKLFARREPVAV